MSDYHKSVLLHEVVEYLKAGKGQKYIDATFGGGGHTREILQKEGIVLGIDTDEDAIAHGKETFANERNFTLVRSNFSDIDSVARDKGFERVSGILFDLGVSSYQLDSPNRGFSIKHDGPLDMRMSEKLTVTARDLVNGLSKKELVTLFEKLGEEYNARRIADAIVSERARLPIETTGQLAELITRVARNTGKIHPGTKVFQALRIAVNDELHSLSVAIQKSIGLLESKGRLIVISFHSLEDRIVKEQFNIFSETGDGIMITKKPIIPSESEKQANKRSRSAKMRVFEKK